LRHRQSRGSTSTRHSAILFEKFEGTTRNSKLVELEWDQLVAQQVEMMRPCMGSVVASAAAAASSYREPKSSRANERGVTKHFCFHLNLIVTVFRLITISPPVSWSCYPLMSTFPGVLLHSSHKWSHHHLIAEKKMKIECRTDALIELYLVRRLRQAHSRGAQSARDELEAALQVEHNGGTRASLLEKIKPSPRIAIDGRREKTSLLSALPCPSQGVKLKLTFALDRHAMAASSWTRHQHFAAWP
jgi:hypothetical protein